MESIIALLRDSIQFSFQAVRTQRITDSNRAKQNKRRSSSFLRTFGVDLLPRLEQTLPDSQIAILSGSMTHPVFRRKEYLFDIHAFEFDYLESPVKRARVPYIVRSLIQIESEFEPSAFDASIDFSKLVCGRALAKAMILTKPRNPERYLDRLKSVATKAIDPLLVALLPHPNSWSPQSSAEALYFILDGDSWRSI